MPIEKALGRRAGRGFADVANTDHAGGRATTSVPIAWALGTVRLGFGPPPYVGHAAHFERLEEPMPDLMHTV